MFNKYSLHFIILAEIFSVILFAQERIVVHPNFSHYETISNLSFKEIKRPKIALVLSGGGARGMAHVGVLKVLEQNNIPIDYIVGTSMGSIVGGLYASGYSTEDLERIIDSTNWTSILSLGDESDRDDLYLSQKQLADRKQLTIRFDGLTPIIPSSLSSGQRLTNFINQLTLQSLYHPVRSFDDLKIPFRSVATDLVSGKRIVFSKGSVSEALRASISVPLLYSPIKKDTLELTDGGLVSNIPVDVAKELGAEIIIAVDVTSPLRTSKQLGNAWEVADQIINIMAQSVKRELLGMATIVVKPDLGLYSATDFTNLRFLVQQGEYAMKNKIPSLKDSILIHSRNEYYDSSPLAHFQFTIQSLQTDSSCKKFFDSSTFANILKLHTVPELREAITNLYTSGWFSDISAEIVLENTNKATVSIRSVENPYLQSISISGNSIIATNDLLSSYTQSLRKPLNYKLLRNATEDVLTLYRKAGYSLARIHTVSYDSVTKELSVEINEGKIAKISFEGKTLTRDWVIRRELPFEADDIFTVQKAKQALENLTATNLFEQALIDIQFIDEAPVIVINTKEKKPVLTRIGFRLDSERNLQPTVSLRSENILGTATEAGISFAGGLRNQKYVFDIKAIRVLNSYFTASIKTYYDTKEIFTYENNSAIPSNDKFERLRAGTYKQNIGGVTFELGQQVERFGTVSIDYRIEANELNKVSGRGYTEEQFTLQAFRVSSLIDTQDKFPFARSGSVTYLSWENATSTIKEIIGTVGYSKIFLSYEWYTTIGVHTIHPKFQVGFGDKTLPIVQQFSWGGEDSFYGLMEDDSRGRQIFLTSVELRSLLPFKLVWDTYTKIRYDFGNIWPQQENISFRDFHHGIGVGLSLDTPIGPANISVGRSFYVRRDLLEQPLTLGPTVTYFSIGYPLN